MSRELPPFKVAAVQAVPAFLDLQAGVQKTISWIAEAARQDCRLAAFPEAWLPGYPYYIWLGAPAWGMRFAGRYHDNSLEIDSEEMRAICGAAGRHHINVVLSYSERSGGSLYLGQAFISEEGKLLRTRRKLKPTHAERTVFGEGYGGDLMVEPMPIGRVGALCCWEHLQPLSKYALFSQDEQIHVASWPVFSVDEKLAYALGSDVNLAVTRTYAVEGQCYVVAACSVMSQDILDSFEGDGKPLPFFGLGGGYAAIFAPDGRQIGAHLPPDQEGLVVAEIDLSMIKYAKMFADPAGHYAKPDVTRLVINRESPSPVTELNKPSLAQIQLAAATANPQDTPQ